jgi:hypothetical protein
MDSLVEQVAIDFCDEDETRYLLERGISYRVITFDSNNKVDSLNFISFNTYINDE